MYVSPPKFTCWNPNTNVMVLAGGAFGRWLGQEGGNFMNGINVLEEEILQSSLIPFHPC